MPITKSLVLSLVTLILIVAGAQQAYAVGGYWRGIGGKPYTVQFSDESHNRIVGRFTKEVRWQWDDKGKVTINAWDDQATFVFTDKNGKDYTIPNAVIQKRILDLDPGFRGALQGNIANAVK